MTDRQKRGLLIAAVCRITRKKDDWHVPSLSGQKGGYRVRCVGKKFECNCPDHVTNGVKCKHIYAVEYVRRRGEGRKIRMPSKRVVKEAFAKRTYPQNWRAYNAAQTGERDSFLHLLRDLCEYVPDEAASNGRGRPPLRKSDIVFAACFKVYSTLSCRRFTGHLKDVRRQRLIERSPHFNTIFTLLKRPSLTPILHELIGISSGPLASVEEHIACDSSGFTTSRFIRWFDHKYGRIAHDHDWVKVHIMTGVRTNVVTAVEIRDRSAADTKILPSLLATTAERFTAKEVLADKGYASLKNYAAIAAVGATPYIAFKTIHSGKGSGLWREMFLRFQLEREEFLKHYHKRSNVESTFAMIKAKFRDDVRSRNEVTMKNEVLCKIIYHNICCLIQEMHELGVTPKFSRA